MIGRGGVIVSTRFLFRAQLWDELAVRIPKAKKVRAAIAYLGTGGAALLPLRKGDELVVDMSLRSVRSGTTNPSEIRKLLRRGVKVFSRETLHAKFLIADGVVIVGSSNISHQAKTVLEEAAVVTDDPAVARRAGEAFQGLCTEPVRKEYLARCIAEYRPPRFVGGPRSKKAFARVRTRAKVWFVGGLVYADVPEAEEARAGGIVAKATRRLAWANTEVDYSHYSRKMRFFEDVRVGDWLVVCIRDGATYDAYPPAQFLGVESYSRGRGKRRYMLLRETPTAKRFVSWARVRRGLPSAVRDTLPKKPRTMPMTSDDDADAVLRLWTERGRWRAK